ncbi:MAG: Hint domain-containing protein [Leptolyngbyaceae bacterium]|nr:Hint domain-containing protein [Leptolyngbyaceae bacterium]
MVLINEFQPNTTGTFELSGTPNAAFSGWIVILNGANTTATPTSPGTVRQAVQVTGTFNANGLLVVSIPNLANKSSTVVLSSNFTGSVNDDLDTDNNGTIDNPAVFGTVYDAIGVPDRSDPNLRLYGANLGGTNFSVFSVVGVNTNNKSPRLVFRDSSTGNLNAVINFNDGGGDRLFDTNGNQLDPTTFTPNPTSVTNTFGSPNPECFVTGTRILTPDGDVPVETLKIGDLVLTAAGQAVAVKWIGWQTIQPDQIIHPLRGYPILIKAGALGHQVPQRDLFVSPDHAILVEGLLINAGALINGHSIVQTTPTEPFTYYHIELEQHSLLVAEGTGAESYLPQKENRSWYDNGAEYAQLYPNDGIPTYWPMAYPRVSSKRQLPRFIAQKLMNLAQAETLQQVG